MDMICAIKSLAVRRIRKKIYVGVVFQNSFYERAIRNEYEYQEII